MNRRRLALPAIALLVLAAFVALGWAVGAGRLDGERAVLDDRLDLYKRVLLEVRREREERPRRLIALLPLQLRASTHLNAAPTLVVPVGEKSVDEGGTLVLEGFAVADDDLLRPMYPAT